MFLPGIWCDEELPGVDHPRQVADIDHGEAGERIEAGELEPHWASLLPTTRSLLSCGQIV